MNNKKIKMTGSFIILVVIIILIIAITQPKVNASGEYQKGDTAIANNIGITLNDYYYADYSLDPEYNRNFEKFLAVDLTIKNHGLKAVKFTTLQHFKVDDKTKKLKNITIDENYKKFGTDLTANKSFDITLVFPISESDSYQLLYYPTLKEEDQANPIIFNLDGNNMETKKVKNSVEHNGVDDLKKLVTDNE